MKYFLVFIVIFALCVSALVPIGNLLVNQGYKHRDRPWAARAVVTGGRIRMHMLQYPEARAALEPVPQYFPAYPRRDKIYFWIGLCYEKEHNPRLAREWYRRFLSTWPNHPWASQVREHDARLEVSGVTP